jgi:hypothetical protein
MVYWDWVSFGINVWGKYLFSENRLTSKNQIKSINIYWILHAKFCITCRINRRTLFHPKGHRPEGWYRSRVDTACDIDFDHVSFSYYIGNCWLCIDKVWVGLKFTRKLCFRVNSVLPMLYLYIPNHFQNSKSHVPWIFRRHRIRAKPTFPADFHHCISSHLNCRLVQMQI